MFYQLFLLYSQAKDAALDNDWYTIEQCLNSIEHLQKHDDLTLAHISVRNEIFSTPVNKTRLIEQINAAQQVCNQHLNTKCKSSTTNV